MNYSFKRTYYSSVILLFICPIIVSLNLYSYFNGDDLSAIDRFATVFFISIYPFSAFYVFCTYWYFKRYKKGLEQYDVTEEGLISANQLIPWSQITSFQFYRKRSAGQILVMLADPDALIQKQNWLNRLIMRFNRKVTGTPFLMYALSKQFTPEQILQNLNDAFAKYKKSDP